MHTGKPRCWSQTTFTTISPSAWWALSTGLTVMMFYCFMFQDLLFDAKHNKVKKFILHTNFPGHYNFNMWVPTNHVQTIIFITANKDCCVVIRLVPVKTVWFHLTMSLVIMMIIFQVSPLWVLPVSAEGQGGVLQEQGAGAHDTLHQVGDCRQPVQPRWQTSRPQPSLLHQHHQPIWFNILLRISRHNIRGNYVVDKHKRIFSQNSLIVEKSPLS